jgi:protein-S-isoprenylcysteine O-methyltransferase Ste14
MKISRLRVPAGYLVGALVIVLARPSPLTLGAGAALAAAGEAVRIWASGHIEKTRRLATGGPYAHTRNPLYVGSALMAIGLAVGTASPWVVAAAALYFAAFYPPVIREESAFLRDKFGARRPGRPRCRPSCRASRRAARARAASTGRGCARTASGAPPWRSRC